MSEQKRRNTQRDPFIILGVGINGYRSFMGMLVVLFAVLTVLSLPIMQIYSSGTGYNGELEDYDSQLVKISIGNLLSAEQIQIDNNSQDNKSEKY